MRGVLFFFFLFFSNFLRLDGIHGPPSRRCICTKKGEESANERWENRGMMCKVQRVITIPLHIFLEDCLTSMLFLWFLSYFLLREREALIYTCFLKEKEQYATL